MKKTLTTIALSILLCASANADSLLSDVTKSISKVIGKGNNNPVARIYTADIIRPIHILTALKKRGIVNTNLKTEVEGEKYRVKYTFRGTVYRLTVIRVGLK